MTYHTQDQMRKAADIIRRNKFTIRSRQLEDIERDLNDRGWFWNGQEWIYDPGLFGRDYSK